MPTRSRSDTERHISDLALAFGWRHHRTRCPGLTRDGYADGFPGDTLVRATRMVFAFVAGPSGAVPPPEAAWVEALGAVRSVEVHIVHPGDLRALTGALQPVAGEESP